MEGIAIFATGVATVLLLSRLARALANGLTGASSAKPITLNAYSPNLAVPVAGIRDPKRLMETVAQPDCRFVARAASGVSAGPRRPFQPAYTLGFNGPLAGGATGRAGVYRAHAEANEWSFEGLFRRPTILGPWHQRRGSKRFCIAWKHKCSCR